MATPSSTWVTFDDNQAFTNSDKLNSRPFEDNFVSEPQSNEAKDSKNTPNSPCIEIGVEDLFAAKRTCDMNMSVGSRDSDMDTFVIVSSDRKVSEAKLEDLLNQPWTPSGTFQSSNFSDLSILDSSLFNETMNSVSPETRSLFGGGTVSVTSIISSGSDGDLSLISSGATITSHAENSSGAEPQRTGSKLKRSTPIRRVPTKPPRTFDNSKSASSDSPDPFADLIAQTKQSLKQNQSDRSSTPV